MSRNSTDITNVGQSDLTKDTFAGESSHRLPVKTVKIKHWGRWVSAVVIIVFLFLLYLLFAGAKLDYSAIPGFFVSSTMLVGVRNTLWLAFTSMFLATSLGILLAVMKMSRNPVARYFATFYIWIFRGPPALLQIYLWYNIALIINYVHFGVPFTDISVAINTNDIVTPFTAALLGIGLNEAAFMAEIVRGGLLGVGKGQSEAAQTIGMSSTLTFRRVIFPQAMRMIIPPTGNMYINGLKETALAAPITFLELTFAAQNVSSQNLLVMEALMAAAVWYMILVTIGTIIQHFVEGKFGKHVKQNGGGGNFSRRLWSNMRNPLGLNKKKLWST